MIRAHAGARWRTLGSSQKSTPSTPSQSALISRPPNPLAHGSAGGASSAFGLVPPRRSTTYLLCFVLSLPHCLVCMHTSVVCSPLLTLYDCPKIAGCRRLALTVPNSQPTIRPCPDWKNKPTCWTSHSMANIVDGKRVSL
ncbi:uncharacterized protein LOC62_04G005862 [Vanrija pseudolonga]|uniref:Uncharacterized protein n=1 Tax=Vanrija pseudolonga TaxID=143232 RepID=A0AAF0Y943_9TREE|nr:hypothetical protein LOC62_04G005862 [Vanrija pseudolonga]